MAPSNQQTDFKVPCSEVQLALDLVGLAESIREPGACTCFRRFDGTSLELGVVPGNFSADELAELYRDAGLVTPKAVYSLPLAA